MPTVASSRPSRLSIHFFLLPSLRSTLTSPSTWLEALNHQITKSPDSAQFPMPTPNPSIFPCAWFISLDDQPAALAKAAITEHTCRPWPLRFT